MGTYFLDIQYTISRAIALRERLPREGPHAGAKTQGMQENLTIVTGAESVSLPKITKHLFSSELLVKKMIF